MSKRAIAAVVVALVSCHARSPHSPSPVHKTKITPTLVRTVGDQAPAKKAKGEASELLIEPIAHAMGTPGAVFERIEFDIGYPILTGKIPATVKVTPPLAGKVEAVSSERFAFVPSEEPKLKTEYLFEVTSIDTTSGKRIPTGGKLKVRTPGFAFLGADLIEDSTKIGRVRMRLSYTAAPKLEDLKQLVTLEAKTKLAAPEIEASSDPKVFELTVRDKSPVKGFTIHHQAGIHAVNDASAELSAATTRLEMPGSFVRVQWVAEGSLGKRRYIDVFCQDELEPKIEMYDRRYLEVSERCMPQSTDAIVISPPVKVTATEIRGGFRLLGAFERGSYTVRLPSKLQSVAGSTFLGTARQTVSFSILKPAISIVGRGRYLPPDAWKNLGLKTRNLLSATISIRHIPGTNLAFWLSDQRETTDERTSDLVAEGTLDVLGDLDAERVSRVDLEDLVKDRPPGVYEVSVRGSFGQSEQVNAAAASDSGDQSGDGDGDGEYQPPSRGRSNTSGASDARRFLYTHVNLIAKRQTGVEKTRVWAVKLDTLEPISDAKVKLIMPSGRVVASCSTDRGGGCDLDGPAKKSSDKSEPMAIVASAGDEISYLRFKDVRIEPTSDVSGAPYSQAAPLTAVSYADRGVYRPGETAHLVAIVRDPSMRAPKQPIALSAQLYDPKTRLARKLVAKTNAAGAAAFDFGFSDYADTGKYQVRLYVGKDQIGGDEIDVEEFVPERMAASIEAKRPDHRLGEAVSFRLKARYLFGGSAQGSTYKLHCELKPTRFSLPQFADYSFGPAEATVGKAKGRATVPVDDLDGTLGAGGSASPECKGTEVGAEMRRPMTLEATAAVMESGSGRTTVAKTKVAMHPAKIYVGLKPSSTSLRGSQPITLSGVAVSPHGELAIATQEATVELYQLQRNYYWSRYDDQDSRALYAAAFSESKQRVRFDGGELSAQLHPADPSADYLVRVTADKAVSELILTGSGGGWYDWYSSEAGDDATPSPERPNVVKIAAQGEITVGKTFQVGFDVAFAGRALVAIETDRLVKSEWLDIKPGRNSWQFNLDAFVPNVYVSVLALKNPYAESKEAFLPERAFGVLSIPVDRSSKRHGLKVSVAKEIRSGAALDVKLDLGPLSEPVFATVAAVDEGILRITNFATPDPLGALFAQRALGVSTFETIGWNVAAPAPPKQIGGGDEEDGAAGSEKGGSRAQPIKPVALWSGLVEIDKSGIANVHFDVPTYRGALRVMAVTIGPERLGSVGEPVLVRDPIVVQTTPPRFLVKDDAAIIPVFLSNLSGKPRTVTVSVTQDDLAPQDDGALVLSAEDRPVKIAPVGASAIKLADGASGTLQFAISAQTVGIAHLSVRATADEISVGEKIELPISPALPQIRRLDSIPLKEGKSDLASKSSAWQPGTDTTTVRVVANPYAATLASIDQLLGYPYGCIEQTTSATRPLLAARLLLEEVPPRMRPRDSIDSRLKAGLQRIFSMQTPDGGFGYWPGARSAHLWGTAYATHLLLDAKKENVEVSESRLLDALAFIERSLDQQSNWSSDYKGWGDYRAEPYLQLVLAVSGRGRAGRIKALITVLNSTRDWYYKTNAEYVRLRASASLVGVTLPYSWLDVRSLDEDLYVLKAALQLTGDKRYETELRSLDRSPIYFLREYSYSFYSEMRQRGLELALYGELFGRQAEAKPAVDLMVETIAGHSFSYFNTQELGWALSGIAKQVAPTGAQIDATFAVGEKTLTATRQTPKAAPTWTVRRLSQRSSATVTVGKSAQPLYALLDTIGVPAKASDVPLGDHGLGVTREYLDKEGEAVDLSKVGLGDVIFVKLTIQNYLSRDLANLALVDRLPAGFEIENPRLGREHAAPWMEKLKPWPLEYMNLRDDRLEAFGMLAARSSYRKDDSGTLVYAVRATTAGSFTAPTPQIEAMYDPNVWGRAEPSKVAVLTPFKK